MLNESWFLINKLAIGIMKIIAHPWAAQPSAQVSFSGGFIQPTFQMLRLLLKNSLTIMNVRRFVVTYPDKWLKFGLP